MVDIKRGKEWLSRAYYIDLLIKEKIYLIEGLYTCCGLQGIVYDKISVVSSPDNRLERIMADIDKEQREVERLQKKKAKILEEIISKINGLETSPEKTILMGFYVKGERMPTIAKDLGFATNYCYELRDKGIEKL